MYKHPVVPALLSLQPLRGGAKAYQLRQLMQVTEEYHLTLELR